MPKVSIIIPLYNRADYLETAIDSILNQTYQDFEVIIVDDGSTQDVSHEVEQCIAKAPDKIHFISQKNAGAGAARNAGASHAQGIYVAFLDADDEWLETYLEKTIGVLEEKKLKWVSTASIRIALNECDEEYDRYDIQTEGVASVEYLYKMLLKEENLIGGPSQVVIRQDCFQEAGAYRIDLPVREDWEMWLRLAKQGYSYEKIKEPLYVYKIRQNSITKTGRSEGLKSAYKVFSEYSQSAFTDDPLNKELYAEKMWNIARHILQKDKKDWFLFLKCCLKSQLYDLRFKRLSQSVKSLTKK